MREPFEQREVGYDRQQAPGHDDALASNLVREPAEEDKKRRADHERDRDQDVS